MDLLKNYSTIMQTADHKHLKSPPAHLPNTTEVTVPAALDYLPRDRPQVFQKSSPHNALVHPSTAMLTRVPNCQAGQLQDKHTHTQAYYKQHQQNTGQHQVPRRRTRRGKPYGN